MPEPTNILNGCDFDAATAKALSGKDIIAMVTNAAGTKLLAVSGQQGLEFNLSAESTEAKATKDDAVGGWTLRFHGSKSWDASIDGLYSPTDEATQMVASALANDEYLCLKICRRKAIVGGVEYQPLRMGLALVSSDNFSAPSDDNATYSMKFDGTGKPWLYETATQEERDAAKFTITAATGGEG
ncbi:phage major tail protein, TP901-1 family [Coriobacteriales bacterium OH1046]|nr:phage major tail protein, TP901-1 family [Coriobacteriales bacterium OH1046]